MPPSDEPAITSDPAVAFASALPTAFGPVSQHYEKLMEGVPYRFWTSYLAGLWELHGRPPRHILDLACGTGTLSRMLARKGLDVTGVDIAPGMIARARHIALEENLAIPFIVQDAAELDLGAHRFDTVVSMFDSLNYILDPGRLQLAFARVHAHMTRPGSFTFDLNTEYALAEGMFNQSCTRRGEALHYRWRSRYDPESRLCRVHMRFEHTDDDGNKHAFTEIHVQRAYTKDEITRWLTAAGFGPIFVYDAYSTNPPTRRSDRIFFVALT